MVVRIQNLGVGCSGVHTKTSEILRQPPRLIALMSVMRVVLRIEKKLETRLGDAARGRKGC